MKSIVIIFLLVSQIDVVLCKKYSNYTLFRAIPVNEENVEYFKNLSQYYKVDFWREPGLPHRPVDFMIGPDETEKFWNEAQSRRLYITTIIDDVQRAFDMQTVKTYIRRKMDTFDWNSFYRYKDIYNWLVDLKRKFPKEVKLLTFGRTAENRELVAVRVVLDGSSASVATHVKRACFFLGALKFVMARIHYPELLNVKPVLVEDLRIIMIELHLGSTVIVEGGIHAREWISTAFVTYVINQIVTSHKSNDSELKLIANTYEWIFVPMLNPDGYEYSHAEDRLWRKNRRDGYGIDINRNFDSNFGSVGISHMKTDDTYCGPAAFSEKESIAMADLVESKKDTLEYYLGFHSYGQYIILPYAYSKHHYENFDEVVKICDSVTSRIERRYGTKYVVGTAYDTVGYKTSGVSGCWVKKKYQIPYVVIFELRDQGNYGFALPAQQIMPTCLETMDGVLTLLAPRTEKESKPIPMNKDKSGGQEKTFSNNVVIVFNVLLFIIVRFD